MRVSQGVPSGRKVIPYHPEMFQEYEEVIIYPREEFKRNYMHIKDNMNYIFNKYYMFDTENKGQIYGLWLDLFERVHIIEREMNQFFSGKHTQTYLDTYLYDTTSPIEDELSETLLNVSELSLELSWL